MRSESIRSRKRSRSSEFTDVNEALRKWYLLAVSQNIYHMGPQLSEKAKEIAEILGVHHFKASNGWMDRWKKRYNLKKMKINGEAEDVRGETVDYGRRGYQNYYRGIRVATSGILTKLLVFGKLCLIMMALGRKNHSASVVKKPNRGLPLLLWLMQMERRKMQLSFGNQKIQDVLKGIDKTRLPVQYFNQPKGWMSGEILDRLLSKWNQKLRSKGRSVVLLMDIQCRMAIHLN